MTEANLYLKLDQKDKYQALIKEAIKQDPNNSGLLYNLGLIASQQGKIEEAKGYYTKCLAISPNDINANNNMALLISAREKTIITEMNNLGTSSADNKKYDALQAERTKMYTELLPYYERILESDAKNKDAAQNLKSIYSALGNTVKYKEMKALLESL